MINAQWVSCFGASERRRCRWDDTYGALIITTTTTRAP